MSFSNESARQSGDTTVPPADRRFGRFGRFGRLAARAGSLPIAEAPAEQEVRLRDGHYRHALALADAIVAGSVLLLMSLIAGPRPSSRSSWSPCR